MKLFLLNALLLLLFFVSGLIAQSDTLRPDYRSRINIPEYDHALMPLNYSQTGWFWQNPLPQGNLLYSVDFNKSKLGISVGAFGTILKTTDGGLTWNLKSAPTTNNLIKVDIVEEGVIYAISNLTVFKSTDYGDTWFEVSSPYNGLTDLFFINNFLGFLVGYNGTILKTTDGGNSWINISSGSTAILTSLFFLDSETGIIGGHQSPLLITTNGGSIWTPINFLPPPAQYYIWDIYLLDKKIFVIAGTSSSDYLFLSTDYGQNWSLMIGSSNYLTEIVFTDSVNGLVSGYDHGSSSSGRIFRTTNGGLNWQEIVVNVGYQTWLTSVSFPDYDIAFAVGDHGRMVISTDIGNNWQQVSQGPLTTFNDVSFYGDKGIAVGGGSVVTSDGGVNWIATQGGNGYRCSMPSANICFSAGGYNLVKSTDGGLTWVQHPISSEHYFMTISFCDTLNGVASAMLGPQGKIIRTFDGGITWSQISAIQGHYIYDICFVNPLVIYACSGSSRVFKSTDGGYTWANQNTGTSGSILYAIDFVNPDVGYVAGGHGKILKTTNGGTTWVLLSTGVNNQFYQMDFLDENNGLVAGRIVLQTSDGGLTWKKHTITSNTLYSASMVSRDVWYAVGENGVIMKTTTGGIVPVELISFSVNVDKNNVLLSWSTVSETNNRGFEVERKVLIQPSSAKSNEWESLGFVNGNGTTTEIQNYFYEDKNLSSGKYRYRLKQIDYDGSFTYSKEIEVDFSLPKKFELFQNYPNPFNPVTNINFNLPEKNLVELAVYNVLGQKITTLTNEILEAGVYSIPFDATLLPSGVYIYNLRSGSFNKSAKMLLLK